MVPVTRSPDWKDLYFLQFATVILFLGFVPIGTLVMKKWGYITVFPFASILWWSASVCPGSSDQLEVSPLLEALPAQERKWDCPALPIALRQLWFAQWAPLIPLGIPAEIRQISASKRRPEPAQFIHHFLLPGSACTRPRDQ